MPLPCRWHVVEGIAGCRFAAEQGHVAIIVDALRASATSAMLLHHGARSLHVVATVEAAREAKRALPDALLFGERGGLPPAGFDGGNSPLDTVRAVGHDVIFTTTNGAGCMVAAAGAAAVYFGSTTNASAVALAATQHGRDVVLIPAGQAGMRPADAHEDRAAAAAILARGGADLGEGATVVGPWISLAFDQSALTGAFRGAPHALDLISLGLAADVDFCSLLDVTTRCPRLITDSPWGVVVG